MASGILVGAQGLLSPQVFSRAWISALRHHCSHSKFWRSLNLSPLSVQSLPLGVVVSYPLLQSPLSLFSHQNSTSIGFCLYFKAKIICSLLAGTQYLSSLCLLFPGIFSLPEMKTWVQPVTILLQISVTMSPTMQPLQVLYLPTTYSSHPCVYSYIPLLTAALLFTISVRNIATSPVSL